MEILFFLISVPFAVLVFVLTKKTIQRLRPKTTAYYPFRVFLPGARVWSATYLIVIILLLTLILYLSYKANFTLLPA